MRVLYFLAIIGMLCCINTPVFAKRKVSTHRSVKTHHYVNAKQRKFTLPKVAAPVSIYGASQLTNHINSIIYDNGINADVAVYVKSMQHGDSLYSRNVNTSMTPASTMKLFTAEAALLFLGPDYRFSTQVLTDAKDVKNGVLLGNLYIVLSGDPTLTYNDLLELMLTLRSHQIRAIQGNVYIDNTAYDQRFYGPGWVWKDKDYCYAAPISASIINKNCISIQVASGKAPGRAAQVIKSPKYFYPTISNSVVTKNGRGTSIHLTKGQSSSIYLDGYMSKGRAWGVSYVVSDIPEYNRSLFKSILARMLISVYGNVTFKSAPDNLAYIGTHSSKPLKSLINDMLKKSDNVIAGAIFKKLGQLYSRQPGSWENGSLAVSQILAKNAGVSSSGLRILDGSGLSPDNLATPTQMMKVLDFAFHHYPTSYEFVSALPIAGVDGTLKHRLGNVARKVRAKTGTISGVVSLAGYTQSADKEPLAFVIMVNGSKGMGWRYKAMEDQIVTALTRYRR